MHFCAGLPIILVGCKKDLRRDPRVIEELRKTSQRPVTPEEVSSLPLSSSAPLYSLGLPYDTFSTCYFPSSMSCFPPFTPHPPPHPFPPTYIQLLPSLTISFHPLYLPRWRLRSPTFLHLVVPALIRYFYHHLIYATPIDPIFLSLRSRNSSTHCRHRLLYLRSPIDFFLSCACPLPLMMLIILHRVWLSPRRSGQNTTSNVPPNQVRASVKYSNMLRVPLSSAEARGRRTTDVSLCN